MNNDLISVNDAIKAIEKREPYLLGDKRVDVNSFKNFLRNRPLVNAVPVVRCYECIHRGSSINCPMCYDECYYDEDDGTDYYTVDRTIDDGFCNCGEQQKEGDDT